MIRGPSQQMGTVDIDPEALDCPKCLRPLAPVIFECAAGHLVCSSCHHELPDKNRCASCFITTGYTRCFIPTSYRRCHNLERILRSIRVDCPNAVYGCAAGKMLYHEKAEHEKTCPRKVASLMKRPGRLMKMGPCGGGGGEAKEMDVHGVRRILKLVLWHGVMVDAMRVSYELDDGEEQRKQLGWPRNGRCSEICLQPDEYLIAVKGHVGDSNGRLRLRSLTFIGNQRIFGPYGTEEGAPFELPAVAGGRIIGFHGRSGTFLDAIGTYVKMDA